VRVLDGADQDAIDVVLDLVLAPVQTKDVVVIGEPPGCFPNAARAPVLFIGLALTS
jgi:hypothetical protein